MGFFILLAHRADGFLQRNGGRHQHRQLAGQQGQVVGSNAFLKPLILRMPVFLLDRIHRDRNQRFIAQLLPDLTGGIALKHTLLLLA